MAKFSAGWSQQRASANRGRNEIGDSRFMVTGGLSSLEQDFIGDKMRAPGKEY